jgi:hypothetical protein
VTDSKKIGNRFEKLVLEDLYQNHAFEFISRNVYMPKTGCEVDFVAVRKSDSTVWHVEAKGGDRGLGKRPGAQRTDNVKKAIANASLIKLVYPEIFYVVYFSAIPKRGSYSEQMINLALRNELINEVIYINNESIQTII